MAETRWDRLVADLNAAGITAELTERAYPGGVNRSITLRHPAGGVVVIYDQSWRKNLDVWIGWVVYREGRDGIEISAARPSKKRSEVVTAVRQALSPTAGATAPAYTEKV
jgi:hypothetical protein